MGHLLVIAPNEELQRSLRFALEAERHWVTAYRRIDLVTEAPGRFDCTILDHHGADGEGMDAAAFYALFSPVVLLANELDHPLSRSSFQTILKPLLGSSLSLAVRRAISMRPNPT